MPLLNDHHKMVAAASLCGSFLAIWPFHVCMYVYSMSIANSVGERCFLAIIMFFSHKKLLPELLFSFESTRSQGSE